MQNHLCCFNPRVKLSFPVLFLQIKVFTKLKKKKPSYNYYCPNCLIKLLLKEATEYKKTPLIKLQVKHNFCYILN